MNLFSAIDAVERAGYNGIELSFDKNQFNPFEMRPQDLRRIRDYLGTKTIKPACIATPTIAFLSDRPHEPSIICLDKAGRKQRIDLIKKGIEIAKILEAPIVSFGSGFIRDEHINNPQIDPNEILADSIHECMKDIDDITLVIEPEPGMLIETLDEGMEIVKTIASRQFQLHMDLCHVYCSEKNYMEAIAAAAPHTAYLHVSDTSSGCNVKLKSYSRDLVMDFDFANYLIYFPDACHFLFISRQKALCFCDHMPDDATLTIMCNLAGTNTIQFIDYKELSMSDAILDQEINTYAVSVPGLSFYVLDRAKPILRYLRTTLSEKTGRTILDKKVANTLTGKVHYHEIPGYGEIDFKQTFKMLEENGFKGYATVELYHHVNTWEKALRESIQVLSNARNYQQGAV
jgi:sugar phosphate isomerase/epimerase